MKRQRGRGRKSNGGGGHHHHHNQNRNFESNGPDVKIRGSASHVYEKYQQLARDASSAGDRVAAESYLQHAEHYFRLMRSQQQHQQQNQQLQQNNPQNPQAQNRPDDIGNRDYGGGYANGRDEYDDAPEPMHAAPQQPAAASPLDVVDPEAVEAASNDDRGGEREENGADEPRGRRRRRRRYEGGAPSGAGDLGAEAAEAGQSPTFDRASSS